jgi:transglutaminase-like putative cysteine protease
MGIRVALHHRTRYEYDREVNLSPQIVRLRPAPHCRTPIVSYSLRVTPSQQFLNWQQDPQGNFLARVVFPGKTRELAIEVDLVAEMTVINPFDFFLEPEVIENPFAYADWLAAELQPYRVTEPVGPELASFLAAIPRGEKRTVDYLVGVNQFVQHQIRYLTRAEPGVQTCEETLARRSGSCRDSAWLLVQVLRNLGLAARFVSGYLIQLRPDVKPLDGPAGADHDFTDLHAWAEVFLPGAGWVGLDPTSGLLTGEGHIPLAASPDFSSAAPVTGAVDPCETKFDFHMQVTRIHEDPRVTRPYSEEQWQRIEQLGQQVDQELARGDVRLTMGGEPTFVSLTDMEGTEWNTEALGENKRRMAGDLLRRLARRFAAGPLLHFGQGKWYPGESLPRWALGCYWRADGEPIWNDPQLIAEDDRAYAFGEREAQAFITSLAGRLRVEPQHVVGGYEDVWYYLWKERRLPANVDPLKSNLADAEERTRLARVFEQGLERVVGFALPLRPLANEAEIRWESGPWTFRAEQMFLIPGDSPMGLRLPLDSILWAAAKDESHLYGRDPFAEWPPLPAYDQVRAEQDPSTLPAQFRQNGSGTPANQRAIEWSGSRKPPQVRSAANRDRLPVHQLAGVARDPSLEARAFDEVPPAERPVDEWGHPDEWFGARDTASDESAQSPRGIVRTALCVEARDGVLYIFMPPVAHVEAYLHLIAAVEQTAAALSLPVKIEGYAPPVSIRASTSSR